MTFEQIMSVGEGFTINIIILATTIAQILILEKYSSRQTMTIKFIHYIYFQILNIFTFAESILAVILCLTLNEQLFDIFVNYEKMIIYGGFYVLMTINCILLIAYYLSVNRDKK